MKYIFELRVKNKAFFYPLYMNPTNYEFGNPFTVARTPSLYGGLVLEENGIIERPIIIDGVVGLKPAFYQGSILSPDNPAPTFKPRGRTTAFSLSGPRHLQFLEDRVFRTYADLKRNQDTAASTIMVFHALKDDQHWVVAPMDFRLKRRANRATMYEYHIELVGVSLAAYKDPGLKSPDKSVFDDIKDGVNTFRNGYNQLAGAVKDVQRTIREVERFVNGIGQMVNDVVGFLDEIGNVLDAGGSLVAAPFNVVTSLTNRVDTAIEELIESGFSAVDHVVASYQNMKDALNNFAIHPRFFGGSPRRTIIGQSSLDRFGLSALEAAAGETSDVSPETYARSGVQSGDLDRSRTRGRAPIGSGTQTTNPDGTARAIYTQQYVVTQGDTLQTIATRLLGDARRWIEIAALNRLSPPYVSEQALPGTVRPGDRMLVPANTPGDTRTLDNNVVGASPFDSVELQLYGRDLLLVKDEHNLYDIQLTSDRTDFRVVSGIPCVSQALAVRVETERGTDQLYPGLGFLTIAGVRDASTATAVVESRFIEAVLADPRVRGVSSVVVTSPTPDTREIDADVAIIGSDSLVPIASVTSIV